MKANLRAILIFPLRVLRWLVGHLVVVALLVFGVAGFLLQDELAGFVADIKGGSDGAPVRIASLLEPRRTAREKPAKETQGSTTRASDDEPPASPPVHREPVTSPANDTDLTVSESTTPGPKAASEPGRDFAQTTMRSDPARDGEPTPGLTEDSAVVEPVAEEPARPVGLEQEDQGLQPPGSLDELWAAARKAYWLGDFQTSERRYREATQFADAGPDVFGELGNVLYLTGSLDEAARAYQQSALRLAADGRVEHATSMIDVIAELNSGVADELRQALQVGAIVGSD